MATINYKCNVCDRSVTLVENEQGLTTFGSCILTQGCTGTLIRQSRNVDGFREQYPEVVIGLEDFTPRNAIFTYTQYNSSATWNINHGLNTSVAANVFQFNSDGSISNFEYNKNRYTITVVDSNNLVLTFPSKISGVANITARTSRSPMVSTVATPPALTQVTTNGVFTFAIPKYLTKFSVPPTNQNIQLPYKLSNVPIRISTTLIYPAEAPFTCFENIDFTLLNSPWINWTEILMRKRKNLYTLSKNILNFSSFQQQNLTFSQIPQNTQLQFNQVDLGTGTFQDIESEDLYILLSSSPFTPSDKNRSQAINVATLMQDNVFFVYQNSDFFINTNYIDNTYPPIMQVQYAV
jgi:hypothetical protein